MKHENIADIHNLTAIRPASRFPSLYTPESGMYFAQGGWMLSKEWIVPMFKRTWQYVVEQHSMRRTACCWEDLDEPIQVVQRRARLPLVIEQTNKEHRHK